MRSAPEIRRFEIFRPFERYLIHGFSTRKGGVSKPPYHSLNLGLHTGDARQAVFENRKRYFDALGISEQRVVYPEQVHSDSIVFAKEPGIVPHCDALVTDQAGLYLSIQTADCFPVFIFDPVHRAVGLVHSGWRGTAQNIVGKTIERFEEHFDSAPNDLFIAIGPGVQQSCYQVDRVTAQHFSVKFLLPDGRDHFKLDVQGAITEQILTKGVPSRNIEIDKTCTHCQEDLYYSYRRDGKRSGRMMGIIGLRE